MSGYGPPHHPNGPPPPSYPSYPYPPPNQPPPQYHQPGPNHNIPPNPPMPPPHAMYPHPASHHEGKTKDLNSHLLLFCFVETIAWQPCICMVILNTRKIKQLNKPAFILGPRPLMDQHPIRPPMQQLSTPYTPDSPTKPRPGPPSSYDTPSVPDQGSRYDMF